MQVKMRAVLFTLGSFLLTAAVIGNAYFQRKQFYPSVVFITKSNPSMAVIYTQGFVLVLLLGKLMRKLFFGQLRAAEFEHLIERSWYAVTETCLAFTVFRDDFSPKFVALFTLLLFLKSFHWLAEDRVDFMERSPVVTWIFHVRILSLLLLLASLDYTFVSNAYHSTITKGPSVQLVFGFEYAILLTIALNISIKYILHTIDIESDNPWEAKAVYLLHTELVIGLLKVVLYAAFMFIMVKIHTFPLFAIRPMYLTTRAFKRALQDVIMSRRAIRNMNHLYPDVTAEELANSDSTCIICREEMTTGAKRLPCNHIFHAVCLRSWFQRQQTCPTCRLDVLQNATPQANAANAAGAAPAGQNQAQNARPAAAAGAQPAAGQQGDAPRIVPPVGAAAQPPHPPLNIPFAAAFPWAGPPPIPPPPPFTTGATGATTTTTASSAVPPMMPHMFMPMGMAPVPPFGFGWPANMPPPMPPANFQGLTRPELSALAGVEEESLRNRINCLRNIQLLLDAAVLQMHQYAAATGSPMFVGVDRSAHQLHNLLRHHDPPPRAQSSSETSMQPPRSAEKEPEGATGVSSEPNVAPLSPSKARKDSPVPAEDDEAAALRRLRLRKFATTDAGDNDSSKPQNGTTAVTSTDSS